MRPYPVAQHPLATALSAQIFTQVHAPQFSALLNHDQALRQLPLLAHRYAISGVLTVESIRRANLALLIDEVGSAAELASRMGVSPSQISQWKTGAKDSKTGKQRQLSSESCRKLEAAAGKDQGWMDQQHPSEAPPSVGVGAHPVAQDLSLNRRDDAPIRIEWDRILKDPLKREFQTTMPDASMEPDIPRGAGIIFVTDLQAAPGDWVLIKDRDGNPFVRELRQVKPGRWQAHALNPAFLPMDSDADGLEVLAVFDGLRGRKARV